MLQAGNLAAIVSQVTVRKEQLDPLFVHFERLGGFRAQSFRPHSLQSASRNSRCRGDSCRYKSAETK